MLQGAKQTEAFHFSHLSFNSLYNRAGWRKKAMSQYKFEWNSKQI